MRVISNEVIRHNKADDCEAVYSLICDMESRQLPYEPFRQIYNLQLKSDLYTCLIYEKEGTVRGCINLRMEQQLHHAGKIREIMELVVDGSCRSTGIGKTLFDAACDEAKRHGCMQIEVCCNQLRERTHRFYERQGMHNFHYKFSRSFTDDDDGTNRLGR